MKINWFRLNRSLHRDLGFFCVGLTLIFAISGLALNHIRDFNSNYQVVRDVHQVELSKDNLEGRILQFLKLEESQVKTSYWSSPNEVKVFMKEGNRTLTYNLTSKELVDESVKPRFLLKTFNDLHLNQIKNGWIYISDFYAISLLYLALSGLFMVKGKFGIKGRGGILVALGFLVPVIFISTV